jgi:RecA-family ATPase
MAERVKDLYSKPFTEAPCYVSGGVIPRSGIVLMGGQAKIGKTFLLLDLAHNLAHGGDLWRLDYKVVEPAPVLYFEQEVGETEFQRRVKLRYDRLGHEPPENFFYVSKMKNFMLDTNEGQIRLAKEIKATGAKVVIIDPIGRCLLGDENDNSVIGKFFQRLDQTLLDFPGLTLVISHHFGKPRKDDEYDPLDPYNFRGASKFFDAPDALITLCPLQPHPGEWKRIKGRMRLRQGEEPPGDFEILITPGGVVEKKKESPSRALDGAGPVKRKGGWGHS